MSGSTCTDIEDVAMISINRGGLTLVNNTTFELLAMEYELQKHICLRGIFA